MNVYTYSEARRQLASVLDEAEKGGEVRIVRRDGRTYVLRPVKEGSPFDDIEPLEETHISIEEIVDSIRESRSRSYENPDE